MGIFTISSTITRCYSWVLFIFVSAGPYSCSVKLKLSWTRNLRSTRVKEIAIQNLAKFPWFKLNNVFFTCKSCYNVHVWFNIVQCLYWSVLDVHSYGEFPNFALRFTAQMITRFLEFMNCLKLSTMRSFAFPDVYLRCDGSGVTEPVEHGGRTVNCQLPALCFSVELASASFWLLFIEAVPFLMA